MDMGTTADDDEDVLPKFVSILAEQLLDSGAFSEYSNTIMLLELILMILLFVVDDSAPNTCLQYENDNCWNGTANVTMDNVYFTDKSVEGQSMYYHTVACQ